MFSTLCRLFCRHDYKILQQEIYPLFGCKGRVDIIKQTMRCDKCGKIKIELDVK